MDKKLMQYSTCTEQLIKSYCINFSYLTLLVWALSDAFVCRILELVLPSEDPLSVFMFFSYRCLYALIFF